MLILLIKCIILKVIGFVVSVEFNVDSRYSILIVISVVLWLNWLQGMLVFNVFSIVFYKVDDMINKLWVRLEVCYKVWMG